jgi:hypothetical protein
MILKFRVPTRTHQPFGAAAVTSLKYACWKEQNRDPGRQHFQNAHEFSVQRAGQKDTVNSPMCAGYPSWKTTRRCTTTSGRRFLRDARNRWMVVGAAARWSRRASSSARNGWHSAGRLSGC